MFLLRFLNTMYVEPSLSSSYWILSALRGWPEFSEGRFVNLFQRHLYLFDVLVHLSHLLHFMVFCVPQQARVNTVPWSVHNVQSVRVRQSVVHHECTRRGDSGAV